jgi:hypothetical protein
MADPLRDFGDAITALGSNWTKYTVVGSFLLYVVGYLALRFHLTAIGVGTDLAVLDERYLLEGARFLVYLVSSVPVVVFLLLLASVAVAPVWAVRRALPETARRRIAGRMMHPVGLTLFGILFTEFVIQFVMRQCFFFHDLLLADALPSEPAWLARLLLDDRFMPLYFSAMMLACAVPIAILAALRRVPAEGPLAFARVLLAFLVAVQVLMLPVNYGVLIVDNVLPRVAALGETALGAGDEAWLVWEGKDGVTFLVRHEERKRRTLLTLARSDVKRIEILGFDPIFPKLFGAR